VLRIEERLTGTGCFYHKKWYGGTYGLGVFKEGIVPSDHLHEKRCNKVFI
jgi:hypothetical protein